MIPIMRPELPPFEEYAALLRRVWDSHMLSNFATFAQQFEQGAQAQLGTARARAVVNGDVGLVLALAAFDLPEGSEAIVPSFTFNSTVNAILWNGLVPVFADIDPATLTMPASEIERLAGPKTRLVLATHTFGNPCDADAIGAAAEARSLKVVYDAAHAFGSRYRGRAAGTLGDAEVFSFSGTKLVTSAEGGLVTGRTDAFIERIEYLRAYGFRGDYETRWPGLNGKMSELHAALGTLTVAMTEHAVARRQAIAARYQKRLKDVAQVSFQTIDSRDRTTWKDFALLCDTGRDGLEARLTAAGVQTKRYFRPAHTMRGYRRYARGSLPATESVYGRILCVPIYNDLPESDVDFVADEVRAHFQDAR